MNKYSIHDFENLSYTYRLPDTILDTINKLTILVDSPEYNKTPIFQNNDKFKTKKKGYYGNNNNNNYNHNNNYNNNYRQANNEVFENTEVLVKTVIKKNTEGVLKEVDCLRKFLNKLTESNYDTISSSIIAMFVEININYSYEDALIISDRLFNMVVDNTLFSGIYAKLFFSLKDYKFIMETIHVYFNKFSLVINSYRETDCNKDVDKETATINNLTKNKASVLLLINLMKQTLISNREIIDIIIQLQDTILITTNIDDKKIEVDELTELLYVMLKNTFAYITDPEIIEKIANNINYLANMKVKNRVSITNKAIFKHMDMRDELLKKCK